MTLTYLAKIILMWLMLTLIAEVFSEFFPAWALLPAAMLLGSILIATRS